MYDKILVPLDGSELAEVSLPYAEELASRLGSEITLIYLSPSENNPYYNVRKLYLDNIVNTTKGECKELCPEPELKAINIKSAMLVGNVGEEIVHYADNEDMGLIVLATHGRSGIKKWAMGSVASKVITGTRRPVMLIRAREGATGAAKKGTIDKMLLPLDGSAESESILPHALMIASNFKSDVVLLQSISLAYPTYTADAFAYVTYTDQQMDAMKTSSLNYLEKIAAAFREKGIETRCDVRFGSAAEEIINYAEEIEADLVAMTTHGRSGIGRWLFGSTTIRMVKGGNTNLLLVRV